MVSETLQTGLKGKTSEYTFYCEYQDGKHGEKLYNCRCCSYVFFPCTSVRRDGDVSLHNRIGDGGGVGEERQPLSKRFRNACRPPPLDVEAPDLGSVTISEPELEIMGLSKYGYKYLKWIISNNKLSIVTLIITLLTKSHGPL